MLSSLQKTKALQLALPETCCPRQAHSELAGSIKKVWVDKVL